MKKILLMGICLAMLSMQKVALADTSKNGEKRRLNSFSRNLLAQEHSIQQDYADFKNWLSQKAGLTYSLDISFLGQRAAPNGKGTPWQTQYYGTANWDMFQSDKIGNGSLQIAYTAVRYWGKSAQNINDRIGVISSFNDYTTNANYFDQLSYTHQFPGDWNGLSVTVGQFPMYNFDGGNYN